MPEVDGIRHERICYATDVLDGKIKLKDRILIIGGGLVGCELALKLAAEGIQGMTILEMKDDLATDVELFSRWALVGSLAEEGVKCLTGCTLKKVEKDHAMCVDREGQEIKMPFDWIVIATGLQSERTLFKSLTRGIQIHFIGDSLEPRKIINAVSEGFNVGMEA
jgi:2-enoate reductase